MLQESDVKDGTRKQPTGGSRLKGRLEPPNAVFEELEGSSGISNVAESHSHSHTHPPKLHYLCHIHEDTRDTPIYRRYTGI